YKENVRYQSLSSKSFFEWLLKIKDASILSDTVAEQLCRDKPREDSLPYSLSQMGYEPPLLNRELKQLGCQNILKVNFSLIYPILQYLEGVYYVTKIAQSIPEEDKEIVLLLPNKEFTYYLDPIDTKS